MRAYLAVMVALVGCAEQPEVELGETNEAIYKQCPDPDNCTLSNGGGTYTEEFGDAHIGPRDFMITTLLAPKTFDGRGRDIADPNKYKYRSGTFNYARLGGVRVEVLSIVEHLTVPTFKVSSPQTGVQLVTGPALMGLELVLNIDGANYTVSFAHEYIDQVQGTDPSHPSYVYQYDMRWNAGETKTASTTSYCHTTHYNDAIPVDDPVVFQQGMKVDVLTAVPTYNSAYVTLSCKGGAIATVRQWGYVYRGDDSQDYLFEAAMHMKRASYCGDMSFYTLPNKHIDIKDTANPTVHNFDGDPRYLEAVWDKTPSGVRAKCYRPARRRAPNMTFPAVNGSQFYGQCDDGTDVPICPAPKAGVAYDYGLITDWAN